MPVGSSHGAKLRALIGIHKLTGVCRQSSSVAGISGGGVVKRRLFEQGDVVSLRVIGDGGIERSHY